MEKKEKYKRLNMRYSIDIEASYFYSDKWIKCKIYDISIDGAGVKLNQVFAIGDTIKLEFNLNSEHFYFDARVMNTDGQNIGVQFENFYEIYKNIISKKIAIDANKHVNLLFRKLLSYQKDNLSMRVKSALSY